MNKDKKMLYGIGIVFLFLATVSLSYAYFTATIVNKDVKDQVVQTGTLELTYTDGPEIIMNNIKPGATITKEISVKNTGTLNTSYNLVWQELANEIIKDEMVIEATCTRLNANGVKEGTCGNLETTPIGKIRLKEKVSIEPSVTHKYNITITFKEINADQNYNQDKNFTGTLGINEYVENTPIYCTFDGDMVQGAEYVNGQYTYRYMQEYGYDYNYETDDTYVGWTNINNDGWGVILTDKDSTEPVTTKLCTYINNRPIVSMSYMFASSQAATLDVSNLNTSNVTNMSNMFYNSQATTLDLSNFNTSNVTYMSSMFASSQATILDLSSFDTSKVTDMSGMFEDSSMTKLDVSNFNTSNVTNMAAMFYGSNARILDLSNFDTSNVTNMSGMFEDSSMTKLDVSNFNTSNVTNMAAMFYGSNARILDLSNFDTSNVTNMSNMFKWSKTTNINLSNFNTSNVTNMGQMFYYSQAQKIIGLDKFNTYKVTNMNNMFYNSQVVSIDVSSFDTSNVTNMTSMFEGTKISSIDLSNFDTQKVVFMGSMFASCPNLTTIYASNKFVTNAVTNGSDVFDKTTNLVGGAGTKYNSSFVDKTYARIDGGTSSPGYFTLKNN